MIVGHIGGSGESAIDTGDIQKSLRFAASRSTYLSRTFGTPTDNNVWTYSVWVKRGALADTNLLTCFLDSSNYTAFRITSADKLEFVHWNGGALYATALSGPVYRDPTAHLHIVIIGNRVEGTDSNRIKMYVNNVQITAWTTTPTWNAAQNVYLNQNRLHHIGRLNTTYADGYLSRICFVDGAALTPSSFGYQNAEINEWITKSQSAVKSVVDAGGANSFMLDFDNGTSLTTLGYDKSSKGNNWTLNNHSLTAGVNYDWMDDVPGNSFAVLNPLFINPSYISEGSLKFIQPVAGWVSCMGTVVLPSEKTYFEGQVIVVGGANSGTFLGLATKDVVPNSYAVANAWTGGATGGSFKLYDQTTTVTATGTPTATDIYKVAYDATTGKLWLGSNSGWWDSAGGLTGNPSSGTNQTMTLTVGTEVLPHETSYANGFWTNFGQRPFAYTPPTGFKALNQRNLPDGSSVTLSGSFTGNAAADGPYVWLNGSPDTLTINGNAVTFGTHADRLATGFKVRSSSASYNTAGSNTFVATVTSNLKNCFKYNNAKDNT